ncbi:hypothetical protein C0995_012775 [Termitomyces sp. Mi166|nr:hypothetical protein C0995_012775 [Termitomyces sp. Mi166\
MVHLLKLALLSLAGLAVSQDRSIATVRHAFKAASHTCKSLFQDRPVDRIQALVNRTAAISGFMQPTPPAGSDPIGGLLKSVVFFPPRTHDHPLVSQPTEFNDQTLVTPTTPTNLFNISAFAATTELGDPIAGTFMRVGPDPTESGTNLNTEFE